MGEAERVSLDGADIEPDMGRFVEAIATAYAEHPPFASLSPADARAVVEIVRATWAKGGPHMARTTEARVSHTDGAVRARLYDPGGAGLKPALVHLHGGGWTLFSIDTHDRLMREYATLAKCVVVGVDYAYSPENRFPVALEQTAAVVRWLGVEGATHGVDPERMAIGGDSAGGNLAIATCLMLRDAGELAPIKAALVSYGAFDDEYEAQAARFEGPGYMLSRAEMDQVWANYRRPTDRDNPLVRPIIADLHGLPPVFLAIGACDVLAEQNERMAARLAAAGVAVHAEIFPGAPHSFLEAMSIAPLARQAIEQGAEWLRQAWAESAKVARSRK